MCGVAGFIASDLDQYALKVMLDSMRSRGPDGEGYYERGKIKMGMRRLSIIDLDYGWQPFFADNNNVVVFQNGEIYNFLELRRRLEGKGYFFKTNCDTEVLAHGYCEWSIDGLLDRVDGMYAIALFDRRCGCLYLARDRFGEKPLFFSRRGGRFAYSSTLVAIAIMPWISRKIDSLALERYLTLHYCPGRQTILKDVQRVLPGEYLAVDINSLSVTSCRYYIPPLARQKKVGKRVLHQEMVNAVKSRMISDVPVGVFLSGGLDSSIIAAIAAGERRFIDTFSISFGESELDESMYARKVAEVLGTRHHEFQFDLDSFVSLLPEVASSIDEPLGDQALLPLYWLCKEAVKHVTVVLAGEGADEFFSGYSYYQQFVRKISFCDRILASLGMGNVSKKNLNSIVIEQKYITGSGYPILCGKEELKKILKKKGNDTCGCWEKELLVWLNTSCTELQRATAVDVATWLPDDLLVKFDRMAMAHSLEGRAPFLSPKLAGMGLALPDNCRMDGKESKILLRQIAEMWLPDDILTRDKHGFILPMRSWLDSWFKEFGGVSSYFTRHNVGCLEMEEVIKIISLDLADGFNRERFVFALVMFVEWYSAFMSKTDKLRSRSRCSP